MHRPPFFFSALDPVEFERPNRLIDRRSPMMGPRCPKASEPLSSQCPLSPEEKSLLPMLSDLFFIDLYTTVSDLNTPGSSQHNAVICFCRQQPPLFSFNQARNPPLTCWQLHIADLTIRNDNRQFNNASQNLFTQLSPRRQQHTIEKTARRLPLSTWSQFRIHTTPNCTGRIKRAPMS